MKKQKTKLTEEEYQNIQEYLFGNEPNRGVCEYSCFNCSHAMVNEKDELVCVFSTKHRIVEDDYVCRNWI